MADNQVKTTDNIHYHYRDHAASQKDYYTSFNISAFKTALDAKGIPKHSYISKLMLDISVSYHCEWSANTYFECGLGTSSSSSKGSFGEVIVSEDKVGGKTAKDGSESYSKEITKYLTSQYATDITSKHGSQFVMRMQSGNVMYKQFTFESVTLTATYNEPRAIVSVSGGSGGGTYAYESSIKLTANSKAGHTHSGWTCSNGKTYTVKQLTDGLAVKDVISAYETNLTFTATYTVNKYTVTWKNADGTVLETDTGVAYGTTPTYNGSTPTKAYDSSYHYTFKGWDKTVGAITGNTTYTATYNSVAHSYTTETSRTPATCTATGSVTKKCSCGATQTTTLAKDPNNHTGGTEVRNAKAATCTAEGYTGDTYCKGCGVKISSGSTIAKKSHTEVTVSAVAATCTATGLTEGKKCSVCGTVTVAQTTVAKNPNNHTGSQTTLSAVAATCTETGKTEGKKWSCCNAIITAQQTVAALGHSYTSKVTAPTATAGGYTTYTCSRCGHSYKDNYTFLITANSNNTSYGTVSGGGTYNQNATATLTATANPGYKFVQWNDGNKNASRTVSVTASATYTAEFVLDRINLILADTSKSLEVLVDITEADKIYVDTTKVYG